MADLWAEVRAKWAEEIRRQRATLAAIERGAYRTSTKSEVGHWEDSTHDTMRIAKLVITDLERLTARINLE